MLIVDLEAEGSGACVEDFDAVRQTSDDRSLILAHGEGDALLNGVDGVFALAFRQVPKADRPVEARRQHLLVSNEKLCTGDLVVVCGKIAHLLDAVTDLEESASLVSRSREEELTIARHGDDGGGLATKQRRLCLHHLRRVPPLESHV